MRTQLPHKLLLCRISGDGDNPVSHLIGVLDSQVTQSTEALDGDSLADGDVLVADRVEDGDAGAEDGGVLRGWDVGGDADGGFWV